MRRANIPPNKGELEYSTNSNVYILNYESCPEADVGRKTISYILAKPIRAFSKGKMAANYARRLIK